MVILIVAESSTGKTLMAQRLLELYKIPYLSMDHIKMGLYRSNQACKFTPDSDNAVIEGCLWPVLKSIIMTTVENKQHIILEGSYLAPRRLKELDERYVSQIIPVFMGFSPEYIHRNYDSAIVAHRFAIEQRQFDETRPVACMIEEHSALRQACEESGVHYFEIDGDYERETAKIYRWINEQIASH